MECHRGRIGCATLGESHCLVEARRREGVGVFDVLFLGVLDKVDIFPSVFFKFDVFICSLLLFFV